MNVPLVVLDTNVVLDLFVWDNAAADPLRQAIDEGKLQQRQAIESESIFRDWD